jgi:hypothetical protein
MTMPIRSTMFSIIVLATGFALGHVFGIGATANAQTAKVFELRTYTAVEGKLPNLLALFRDDTLRILDKHGMTHIGYWVPQDSPESGNTMIYIVSHDSREAAQASWSAFREDPEWKRVAEESQTDGRVVANVESMFIEATDFSPMK